MNVTPIKIERLFKKMRAICEKDHGPNPYHGELYFRDGTVYAVNACSIVRLEMPFECDDAPSTMYTVDDVFYAAGKVYLKLGTNHRTERDSRSGNRHLLDDLMKVNQGDGERFSLDTRLLMPVLECFKALNVPVRFMHDPKMMHLLWSDYVKIGPGLPKWACLEASVMNRRI